MNGGYFTEHDEIFDMIRDEVERITVATQGAWQRAIVGWIGNRHRLETVDEDQALLVDLVFGDAAGWNLDSHVHLIRCILCLRGMEGMNDTRRCEGAGSNDAEGNAEGKQ